MSNKNKIQRIVLWTAMKHEYQITNVGVYHTYTCKVHSLEHKDVAQNKHLNYFLL